MSKSRKLPKDNSQLEIKRHVEIAQTSLDKAMEGLYGTHSDIVTAWIVNELTHEGFTFEEVAGNLARNFLLAHSIYEFRRIGKKLEDERNSEATADAA